MKTTTYRHNSGPKKSNKKYIIASVTIAFILVVTGGYFYNRKLSQEKIRTEQKQRDEAQTNSSKNNLQSKDTNKDNSIGDETLPNNSTGTTTDKIPSSETLEISIKNTSQNGGTVNASVEISGTTTDGTCVFTYTTPEDRPVIQQISSSNNTCQSNIPEVQFSKLGTWKLNVVFYQNNTKVEASKNVTIH